jgi:mannosyltransferase OCH1-like enzyme
MEKDFINCMFFITFTILIIFILLKSFNNKLPFYTPRKLKLKSEDNTTKILDNIIFNNIPAVVYQYYDSNITSDMINNFNLNLVNNPEFNFYLYNNYDCREFIKLNFSYLLNIYDNLNPNKQVELWKYCILYKNGGIYIDFNLRINDALINILNLLQSNNIIMFTINNKIISTNVIIAPPELPIFKELIESYLDNKIKTLSDLITKYNYEDNVIFYINDSNIINNVNNNITFELL